MGIIKWNSQRASILVAEDERASSHIEEVDKAGTYGLLANVQRPHKETAPLILWLSERMGGLKCELMLYLNFFQIYFAQ